MTIACAMQNGVVALGESPLVAAEKLKVGDGLVCQAICCAPLRSAVRMFASLSVTQPQVQPMHFIHEGKSWEVIALSSPALAEVSDGQWPRR